MKLNFLFISYSVIYAKYSYCYDVPKDMPTKYFDGKEWKLTKTQQHFTTKAPKPFDIIPTELDWVDLIKEMKEIELVEPAPKVTESILTVKDKTTTSKKCVTKMADALKVTIKKRPTLPAPIKTTVNHSPKKCKKQITATEKKYTDRGQKKKIEKQKVQKEMWIYLRPTVKPATVTANKYLAKTTKKCPIIRPTKEPVTTKTLTNISGTQGDVPKDMPTRYFDGKEWKQLKPRHHVRTKAPKPLEIIPAELDWADLIKEMKEIELVEPAPEVTERTPKFTLKKRPTLPAPMKTTVNHSPKKCKKKFTATAKKYTDRGQKKKIEKQKVWKEMWTLLRPTVKPATVTKKKYFAKTTKTFPRIRPTKEMVTPKMPAKLSGTQGDGWNMSENWSNLLKEFLKYVELKKCEPPCKPEATITDKLFLFGDNRRAMYHEDDLMNILMDGVEIDDRLIEDDYLTSQRELVPSKEIVEDQSQILDFEPDEGSSIDYEQEFSDDNELDGDLKSNEVAVSATKKSDEIVKSNEIKSYFEALQAKRERKENELSEDKGTKTSLDEENYSQLQKEQDEDKRNDINDNDLNGQNDANNLLDFSKETLNSKDINVITDDKAPKPTNSTEIKSEINDEDVYQDRDITFDIEALESVGADKY